MLDYLNNKYIYSLPSTYQYSALSQYDNDRDEEINDLEDHLDILIEDSSSSDNEEEVPSKDILDIDAVSFVSSKVTFLTSKNENLVQYGNLTSFNFINPSHFSLQPFQCMQSPKQQPQLHLKPLM